MKKFQALFLALFLVLLLLFSFSCENKNEQPYITIFPGDLEIQAYTNEKIVFTINVLSDYLLTDFVITNKFEGEAESVIFDSTITTKNLNFQWLIQLPQILKRT
jgi:hypothetical protein